ncbi:hypothetical protein, partial [Klebsiella pneumoniae]|uniref:hypothetical protein n=1 Tax=Klebsiella pneumoniae TaxID=573 RepID=UPI00190F5531
TEIVQQHLAAWQAGDASAVAASVATFGDPDTDQPLRADALTAHAERVFAQFAGLKLEVEQLVASPTVALVSWR